MTRRSIRVRLTLWAMVIVAAAVLVIGAGSWWLLRRSAIDAADRRLNGQIASVKTFVERLEPNLNRAELLEEFGESSDLSPGDVQMQVTDASGFVLCRPDNAAWPALVATTDRGGTSHVPVRAGGHAYRVARGDVVVRGATYHVVAAVPMGAGFEATEHLGWLFGILAPVVLVGAGAIGYFVSGRALAPVDRMTRAAQAITLRGLDRRIEVPASDDELHRLATTFNAMLARLQTGVEEMAQFTADASHELRTPVALVRTGAELALRRDRSPQEYRAALVEIREQAERMTRLVDDLLALARADAGVEPRAPVRGDLVALVRDVAAGAQAAAIARGATLTLRAPADPIEIVAETESLRRLVAILVENALKYTPAGGAVVVTIARDDREGGRISTAMIDVADSGIGLDPAETPRLFERFFRGARARQVAADGSGLGLAIARTIAERHGGSVELVARADGPGCRARVTLPLAAACASGAAEPTSVSTHTSRVDAS